MTAASISHCRYQQCSVNDWFLSLRKSTPKSQTTEIFQTLFGEKKNSMHVRLQRENVFNYISKMLSCLCGTGRILNAFISTVVYIILQLNMWFPCCSLRGILPLNGLQFKYRVRYAQIYAHSPPAIETIMFSYGALTHTHTHTHIYTVYIYTHTHTHTYTLLT